MENSRISGEHFFTTRDNTALFYRHWPALQPGAKKVIVLFHRGHEHSGRLQHLVDELAMPDTAFYAWDARGHGKSSGPRGYSPSLARSVRDVDEFVRFAASDSFAVWSTMHGLFPPSSRETGVRCFAAFSITSFPS